MALTITVETGEGLPSANSYVDAAFVEAYAESIGSDVWCNNVSKQTLALIASARFLDMRYAKWFPGSALTADQALMYPRQASHGQCWWKTTVVPAAIPNALKYAQAQLALQYLEEGLDLNANIEMANANNVSSTSVSIAGAITESVSYFRPGMASTFSVADAYIKQLKPRTNSFQVPVIRG